MSEDPGTGLRQGRLTYLFYSRAGTGPGTRPAAQEICSAACYPIRVDYAGAPMISVNGKAGAVRQGDLHLHTGSSDLQFRSLLCPRRRAHPAAHHSAVRHGQVLDGAGPLTSRIVRVAFFSPMPPSKSGIADYSEALAAEMAQARRVCLSSTANAQSSIPRSSTSRSTTSATIPGTVSSTKPRCAIPASW